MEERSTAAGLDRSADQGNDRHRTEGWLVRIMGKQAAVTKGPKARRGYTLGEEIANSVTHGVGAGPSIAALVILVAFARHSVW